MNNMPTSDIEYAENSLNSQTDLVHNANVVWVGLPGYENNTTIPYTHLFIDLGDVVNKDNFMADSQKSIEPVENTTSHVQEKKELIYSHISDSVVKPRRILSLPPSLQYIRGVVSTRRFLPAKTRFGPVQGKLKPISLKTAKSVTIDLLSKKLPIFLLNNKYNGLMQIDVSDEDKSNWLSLIKLGDSITANIWLYQDGCELFAFTTRSLTARAPLYFGYAEHYAREHHYVREHVLLHDVASTDLYTDVENTTGKWQCKLCGRYLATPGLLQRHTDLHHKKHITKRRRRHYKCRDCHHVFTTLFCLRRHKQQQCRKQVQSERQRIDYSDMKLPSDESFQNLLELSSSLLDPDKSLPNLDISGSSKSDDCSKELIDSQATSESTLKCRHCRDNIAKSDRKLHYRSCRGRRFECCGQVFRNNQKFVAHTRHHITDGHKQVKTKQVKKESHDKIEISPYACEFCNNTFKRRGMLVNHYWRKHPELEPQPSRLPVLKRDRLYLCAACPKFYRTSAKRDIHMKTHHPGHLASPLKSYCVETGVRTGNVSSCPLCVKEYVSRAKMLSHMRLKHPDHPQPRNS